MRRDAVTDEMIRVWADEAEAGYDVADLKKRVRGRPRRGAQPMSSPVAVRLDADELAAVDDEATRDRTTRSEIIRRALQMRYPALARSAEAARARRVQ